MKKTYFLLSFLFFSLLGFSQTEYLDGILVLNEGGAGSNNSSISFISEDETVTNNLFGLANSGATMGDTAQSLTMYGDIAVIVLNISNEVKIVNSKTFELIATIADLDNPRYSAVADGKIYVTCWGSSTDDYLAVIDLDTYDLEEEIILSNGTEKIKEINGKLYVAHQGGYGTGNLISVYDPVTETIEEITVGDTPSEMNVVNDILYVLCGVQPWGTGTASLYKIDLTTDTVSESHTLPDGVKAFHMDTDGDYFYISSGSDIYRYGIATDTFENTVFISTGITDYMGIYGMNVIDDKIYVADANGYTGSGFAYVYSTEGTLLNTFNVGVIPNHFYKSAQSEDASVSENTLALVSVYPNPATDIFYVKSEKELNVTIFDIQGKTVKRASSVQNGVNVSDLSKGLYFVELSDSKQKQIVKLIIK